MKRNRKGSRNSSSSNNNNNSNNKGYKYRGEKPDGQSNEMKYLNIKFIQPHSLNRCTVFQQNTVTDPLDRGKETRRHLWDFEAVLIGRGGASRSREG